MDTSWFAAAVAQIAAAARPPRPWADGGQLPWHDRNFSERMLTVHLAQDSHMASRTRDVIARHVDWLETLLIGRLHGHGDRFSILDAACGPGFYCQELATRGHRAAGLDFSPAAIGHARSSAAQAGLEVRYVAEDLTALPADLPDRLGPMDAVTFWFGELHSFPPTTAAGILDGLVACLKPGGLFVLEYQPWDLFPREDGHQWQACDKSVFSDVPHLWLQEFAWDEAARAEINVHWIVEAGCDEPRRYVQCHQAYRDDELVTLLADAGLAQPTFHPPITGCDERFEFPLLVTVKE